jgi:hypothetical protein
MVRAQTPSGCGRGPRWYRGRVTECGETRMRNEAWGLGRKGRESSAGRGGCRAVSPCGRTAPAAGFLPGAVAGTCLQGRPADASAFAQLRQSGSAYTVLAPAVRRLQQDVGTAMLDHHSLDALRRNGAKVRRSRCPSPTLTLPSRSSRVSAQRQAKIGEQNPRGVRIADLGDRTSRRFSDTTLRQTPTAGRARIGQQYRSYSDIRRDVPGAYYQ